jgi:hypothetical protein
MSDNTNYNEKAVFTGKAYGTEINVTLDHSDLEIDEIFDAFQTIVTGLGFHQDSWKEWILDRAEEYIEEDGWDCTDEDDEWDVTLEDGLEDWKEECCKEGSTQCGCGNSAIISESYWSNPISAFSTTGPFITTTSYPNNASFSFTAANGTPTDKVCCKDKAKKS